MLHRCLKPFQSRNPPLQPVLGSRRAPQAAARHQVSFQSHHRSRLAVYFSVQTLLIQQLAFLCLLLIGPLRPDRRLGEKVRALRLILGIVGVHRIRRCVDIWYALLVVSKEERMTKE